MASKQNQHSNQHLQQKDKINIKIKTKTKFNDSSSKIAIDDSFRNTSTTLSNIRNMDFLRNVLWKAVIRPHSINKCEICKKYNTHFYSAGCQHKACKSCWEKVKIETYKYKYI